MNTISKFLNTNKFRIFLSLVYLVSFYAIYKATFGDVSTWWLLIALIWSKAIQLVGHSIGMHRYFTHKSFDTTLRGEKFMAWTSFLLGVGSPIQYARNHRQHHKISDKPNDWASPKNDGKLYTALGIWEFNSLSWFMSRGGTTPRDLIKHPTYMFIHNYYYIMWFALAVATLLINWHITLYLLALPSLIYHFELNMFVNCSGHSWGYRTFETDDESRNSKLVQWWTLGEGLHNNHHANAQLYDFAVKHDESDVSAWFIEKFLAVDGKNTQNGKMRID